IDGASQQHPRLLASRNDFAAIADSLSSDPFRKQVADAIIAQANALDHARPVEHKLVGRRMLGQSRLCLERVMTLAMAFHLPGKKQYADRGRQEMLAAARFSDWNPSHFLDVAEMTCGLAIGYDWLYDQLDDGNRREIRAAIVEKSLRLPFETKY